MLKNISTTYGKEEEVRDQAREMYYFLFPFMQPGFSVLKAVTIGDFLRRLGGHSSDRFLNKPNQFQRKLTCDCKHQIPNF